MKTFNQLEINLIRLIKSLIKWIKNLDKQTKNLLKINNIGKSKRNLIKVFSNNFKNNIKTVN